MLVKKQDAIKILCTTGTKNKLELNYYKRSESNNTDTKIKKKHFEFLLHKYTNINSKQYKYEIN